MAEARFLSRGFQHIVTWNCSNHIKGACQRGTEGVTAFYHSHYRQGSHSMVELYTYSLHDYPLKYNISNDISNLIYSRKSRMYVAACKDLALRTFSADFELTSTIRLSSAAIGLAFNDSSGELYSGGIGEVLVWKLMPKLHNPLTQHTLVACSLKKDECTCHLDYDAHSNRLIISSRTSIYIVDVESNVEVGKFCDILHRTNITCAVHCGELNYLIVGSSEGTISVWNCELDSHVYYLRGHLKAVTGMATHHSWCPSAISCSLDKTIKMWNLENMMEYYSVHCDGDLLGLCWEFPKLTCYGDYFLTMWNVSQFESHFASLNADVLRLARIDGSRPGKSNMKSAKILAQTDDGGVKLLSPVNGEAITTLFPMFSSQLLEDVVYSFSDSLLFVLLTNNHVLVCDTKHNPCMTKEIWVSNVPQFKINTLAMCNVSLSNGKVHCLIFGGQLDGDIALLHSTRGILSMVSPRSAHDSQLTMLVGASNVTPNTYSRSDSSRYMQSALVSYGKISDRLHIWAVVIDEKAFTLELEVLLIVKMTTVPRYIVLSCSTVCMVLEDDQLRMFRNRTIRRQSFTPQVVNITSMELLRHQSEDGHTNTITSLNACSYLKLFVSSSVDGKIKVWSFDNQMVAEIDFGVPLSSVGFANDQGDLLVGLQLRISIVKAVDYLPDEYYEVSRNCPHFDYRERPVGFDPTSEFWYDSSRVPPLPLCQERRQYYLQTYTDLDLTGFPSNRLRKKSLPAAASQSPCPSTLAVVHQFSSEVFDSELESLSAKVQTPQYFTAFKVASSKSLRVIQVASIEQAQSLRKLVSSTSFGSKSSNTSGTTALCGEVLSSVSLRVEVSYHSIVVAEPWYSPWAQVGAVDSPSVTQPIAPDGHIPNSVIRGFMVYKPPVRVVTPGPYRPPKIKWRDQQVVAEPTQHEIDMYSWLLERLVKKCRNAGVDDASGVVSAMTEIIRLSPERTEDVTRALVEHLRRESDFDLITFLNCFTDEDTLKRRFGDEVYTSLFRAHTTRKREPSPEAPSFSSEYSSLPSPSRVDYTAAEMPLRKPYLVSTGTSASSHPITQSTSYSSFSVPPALRLKWADKGRPVSAGKTRPPAPLPQTAKWRSQIAESASYGSEQRQVLSSATTRVSLTLPSESTALFTPSEFSMASSTGRRLEALRSILKKSDVSAEILPTRRRRPSSVTFASSSDRSGSVRHATLVEPRRAASAEPSVRSRGRPSQDVDFVTALFDGSDVLSVGDHMLKEAMLKPWFPEAYKKGDTRQATINNVFDGLLEALGSDNIDFFGEVCDTLLDLHQSSLLTPEQGTALTLQLAARLNACSSLTRQIEKMNDGNLKRDDYSYEDTNMLLSAVTSTIRSAPPVDHPQTLLGEDDYRSLSSRLHRKMRDSLSQAERSRADSHTSYASTLRIGSEISPLGTEFGGSEYGEDMRSDMKSDMKSDMEFGSEAGRSRIGSEMSRGVREEAAARGSSMGGGSVAARSSIGGESVAARSSISSLDATDCSHVSALDGAEDMLRYHSSHGSGSSVDGTVSKLNALGAGKKDVGKATSGETQEGDSEGEEADSIAFLGSTFFESLEGWLQKLIKRTSSTELAAGLSKNTSATIARSVVTVKLLKALEKLGEIVNEKEIVLPIVPLLIDENGEVQEQAKATITAIAGVKTREELYDLLVRYDIIKHVDSNIKEILGDLYERWKKDGVPQLKYLQKHFPKHKRRLPLSIDANTSPTVQRSSYRSSLPTAQRPSYQSSYRSSASVKLIQKIRRSSLKTYSTSQSDQEEHLHYKHWPKVKQAGRWPKLKHTSHHDTKPEPAKQEVLCTLYTRDEELKTTGEAIQAYASSTAYYKGSLVARKSTQLWDSENIDMRRSRVKDPKMLSEVYRELILHPNTCYESEVVQQWQLERSGPDPNERRRARSWDAEGMGGAKGKGEQGYTWPVRRHTTGCVWPATGSHKVCNTWQVNEHTTDVSSTIGLVTMPGPGGVAMGEAGHAVAGGEVWYTAPESVTRREATPDPGDGFLYFTLKKTTQLQQKLDGSICEDGMEAEESFREDKMAAEAEESFRGDKMAAEAEAGFRARSEDSGERRGEMYGSLFEWSEVYPVVKTSDGLLMDKCRTGFQARAMTPLPPIPGTRNGIGVRPAMGTRTSISMRAGVSPGMAMRTDFSPGMGTRTDYSPGMGTRTDFSPGMGMRTDFSPGMDLRTDVSHAVGMRGSVAMAHINGQQMTTNQITNTIHVKLPRIGSR